MPHDANGKLIQKGDHVDLPCIVTGVNAGEEYCNCTLETLHPMFPAEHKTSVVVNTRQVVLPPPDPPSSESA